MDTHSRTRLFTVSIAGIVVGFVVMIVGLAISADARDDAAATVDVVASSAAKVPDLLPDVDLLGNDEPTRVTEPTMPVVEHEVVVTPLPEPTYVAPVVTAPTLDEAKHAPTPTDQPLTVEPAPEPAVDPNPQGHPPYDGTGPEPTVGEGVEIAPGTVFRCTDALGYPFIHGIGASGVPPFIVDGLADGTCVEVVE